MRRKILTGGNWLLLRALALGMLDMFCRAPIFRRVIDKDGYGLMALAMVAYATLEAFTNFGLESVVLRDQDPEHRNLPAYWTLRFVRGMILAAVLWFLAPWVATYYGREELTWLVRVLCIPFLLGGLTSFGNELCQRQGQFRRIAFTDITMAVVVLLISLSLLRWIRGPLLLATHMCLMAAGTLVTSYYLHPWRGRLCNPTGIIRTVAIFSGAMIGVGILNYFSANIDRSIIGRLLGAPYVGLYAGAIFLAALPIQYIAMPLAPVFLPAFREAIHDPGRLRRMVVKATLALVLLLTVFCTLFGFFGDWFVMIVWGSGWMEVVPLFRLLLPIAVLRAATLSAPIIFMLKDKPWLTTICTGLKAAVFAVTCYPLSLRHGMTGTAASVLLAEACSTTLALVLVFNVLRIRRPSS